MQQLHKRIHVPLWSNVSVTFFCFHDENYVRRFRYMVVLQRNKFPLGHLGSIL